MMDIKNQHPKLLLPTFCAIIVILGFQVGGLQLVLLRAVQELNLGGAMMGLPLTAQFISLSVTPLVFGPISDKIGKKKIIAAFMLVFSVGSFLTGLYGSVVLFLVGLFITGAGYSVCECSVTAAISDIFEKSREKYINLCQSFFCVGAALSPLVLQWLMRTFSLPWRVSFFICAIAMIITLPVFLLSYPKNLPKMEEQTSEQTGNSKRLLLLGFILCMLLYVGVEGSIAAFADSLFTLELGMPVFGAYAIALFWVCMGIGRSIFGRMKKIPQYATSISLICMAVILFGIAFGRQEMLLLILFAASGLACSCVWPGITNAAVARNPGASGAVMSYLNLGAGVGGAVFPLIMSTGMEFTSLFTSFAILATFSLVAGIFMWRMNRKA